MQKVPFTFVLLHLCLFLNISQGQTNKGDRGGHTVVSVASTPPFSVSSPIAKKEMGSLLRNPGITSFGNVPIYVSIIESRSYTSGHVMDTIWAFAARSIGLNATILPQTALDDTAFFSQTDLLIISSGVIDISDNRANTILLFIKSGKSVYFQNEYLCNYSSNIHYAAIVDSLGGTFTPAGTVDGALAPMEVMGTLSMTPNPITSLAYFWYGCHGNGDSLTVIPFMRYDNNYFGFIFIPPNPAYGKVIMTVDQDWILSYDQSMGLPLMENILIYLSSMTVGIPVRQPEAPQSFHLNQNYPNPFKPTTAFVFSLARKGRVKFEVYNERGQLITTIVDGIMEPGNHHVSWDGTSFSGAVVPAGSYFYRLSSYGASQTKRMIMVK